MNYVLRPHGDDRDWRTFEGLNDQLWTGSCDVDPELRFASAQWECATLSNWLCARGLRRFGTTRAVYRRVAPCVYSTLASVTTVVQSLAERVVVRASPRSLPRASHNTQRTHTQRDDVRTRGARTRPSDNARARVRQIDSDTQHTTHNTHTTRRSVVHRLVVGLIPIRTIGIGCFRSFSVYYQWIIHIIWVFFKCYVFIWR